MPTGLADASNLLEGLVERDVPLSLVLFNRAFTTEPLLPGEAPDVSGRVRALRRPRQGSLDLGQASTPPELESTLAALARRVASVRAAAYAENQADLERMRAFVATAPGGIEGTPSVMLPRATGELTRLADLSDLLAAQRPLSAGLDDA
jgi:hypothetical protein